MSPTPGTERTPPRRTADASMARRSPRSSAEFPENPRGEAGQGTSPHDVEHRPDTGIVSCQREDGGTDSRYLRFLPRQLHPDPWGFPPQRQGARQPEPRRFPGPGGKPKPGGSRLPAEPRPPAPLSRGPGNGARGCRTAGSAAGPGEGLREPRCPGTTGGGVPLRKGPGGLPGPRGSLPARARPSRRGGGSPFPRFPRGMGGPRLSPPPVSAPGNPGPPPEGTRSGSDSPAGRAAKCPPRDVSPSLPRATGWKRMPPGSPAWVGGIPRIPPDRRQTGPPSASPPAPGPGFLSHRR